MKDFIAFHSPLTMIIYFNESQNHNISVVSFTYTYDEIRKCSAVSLAGSAVVPVSMVPAPGSPVSGLLSFFGHSGNYVEWCPQRGGLSSQEEALTHFIMLLGLGLSMMNASLKSRRHPSSPAYLHFHIRSSPIAGVVVTTFYS